MTLSAGTIIDDKYQIQSIIGSGGMGSVYRVHQVLLNKAFALKIIDVQQQSETAIRRFQLEARTTAQLRHPNLVEVVDFGIYHDSQPYIVMDLIEGLTLSQLLKKSGSLSVEYVIQFGIEVAKGLAYAHSKGVVHRDIKPGNIIVLHANEKVEQGGVKIVDFGIAKIAQSEGGQIQELTKTGEIFGSPVYMSPEQCQGTPVDQRTDIYSLGCVLFECLTGSPPFLAENAMSTMVKRLTSAPVSLKEGSLGLEFPAALEDILNKMLRVNPNDRYQHMDTLIDDLQEFQSRGQTTAANDAVAKCEKKRRFDRNDLKLVAAACAISSGVTFLIDISFFLPKSLDKPVDAASESADASGTSSMTQHFTSDTAGGTRSQLTNKTEENGGLKNAANTDQIGVDAKSAKDPDQKDNSFMVFAPKNIDSPTRRIVQTERGPEEFLHFPYDSGEIFVAGPVGNATADPRKALGDPHFALGSKVSLVLNEETSKMPSFLRNLTDVNFFQIRFVGALTTNDAINILEHIKHLDGVDVSGTEISSLKPIYDAKQIINLDTTESQIPASELVKIKRLNDLKNLQFGPIADPQVVLNAMRNSKSIVAMAYRGPRKEVAIGELGGRGLKEIDIDALVKLQRLKSLEIQHCPEVDDACLRKLVGMKSLERLTLLNCSITPKSLSFLKTCHLRVLELDAIGWSNRDLAQLETGMPFRFWHPKYQLKELKNATLVKDITNGAGMLQAGVPLDEHSPTSSRVPK